MSARGSRVSLTSPISDGPITFGGTRSQKKIKRTDLNQAILDRLDLIDDRAKKLEDVKPAIMRILDTLISYDERIRRLEDPNRLNYNVTVKFVVT